MKHYNVVAAVVCHNGKYLCMQKGKTKFEYTSYKWEFPGGKIEPGEYDRETLKSKVLDSIVEEYKSTDVKENTTGRTL